MERINTESGLFSDGTPGAGYLDGTVVSAKWANDVQEELCAIPQDVGIALDPSKRDQVRDGIKRQIQTRKAAIAVDTGVANAYTAAFSPAITALSDGLRVAIKIKVANTGSSTFAADEMPATTILGAGLEPLQGGELVVGSYAELEWLSSLDAGAGAWILIKCAGAPLPIAPASNSYHAMQLGQATGRLLRTTIYTRVAGVQNVSVNGGAPTAAGATTFDKLPDTAFADVELCGGGGGTGGIIATTSGQQGFAAGGAGAAYARGRFDSGLTGVSVTVGAGGAAGITGGNPGGNGGTSSFGALISAAGGNGSPAGALNAGVSSLAGINGATTVTGANLLRGSGGRGAGWLASGLGFATGGDAGVSGMGFPNSYGSGGIGRYQAPSQGALAGVAGVDGVVIVREYA